MSSWWMISSWHPEQPEKEKIPTTGFMLVLQGLGIYVAKDRAILADIFVLQHAMATLANTTLHRALKANPNLMIIKASVLKQLYDKLYHDGRTASDYTGIASGELGLLQKSRDKADIALPFFIALVNSHIKVEKLAPLFVVFPEQYFRRAPVAEEDVNRGKELLVCLDVLQHTPQGSNPCATTNNRDILSMKILHRKSLAIWTSNANPASFSELEERIRNVANVPHAQVNVVLRIRADGDWCFTNAVN
jgi:hypothetical protein